MSLTGNYDFEGIVALSNCSGSIVALEHSQPTDQALILTNGHCLESGMPKPGTFVAGQPNNRRFGVLSPNAQQIGVVTATQVVYSTMTGTDITIYQLRETYNDIMAKFKVRPYLLSSQHPVPNQQIQVISGYWRRGYTCAVEAFVPHVREGGWQWDDSLRYSRPGCEVIGGTSGSPVVLAGSRTVVAINNTINENGQQCTVDNPCEISTTGQISYQQGLAYAEETYQIYSCINSVNQFDLHLPTCRLLH